MRISLDCKTKIFALAFGMALTLLGLIVALAV